MRKPATSTIQQHPSLQKNDSYSNIHTISAQQLNVVNQNYVEVSLAQRINLQNYPMPHPSNPLSEHLSKLNPPNDATLTFFSHLFAAQASEKITVELQNYAKVILACILKGNIDLLDRRN
jgi:hypothetical protein